MTALTKLTDDEQARLYRFCSGEPEIYGLLRRLVTHGVQSDPEPSDAFTSKDVAVNPANPSPELQVVTVRHIQFHLSPIVADEIARLRAEVLKLESHIVDVYNAQEAKQVETKAESVSLDYRIPCDVRLPPSTGFGKGCTIRSLMSAFRMREGSLDQNLTQFNDARAEVVRAILDEMRGQLSEKSSENLSTSAPAAASHPQEPASSTGSAAGADLPINKAVQ